MTSSPFWGDIAESRILSLAVCFVQVAKKAAEKAAQQKQQIEEKLAKQQQIIELFEQRDAERRKKFEAEERRKVCIPNPRSIVCRCLVFDDRKPAASISRSSYHFPESGMLGWVWYPINLIIAGPDSHDPRTPELGQHKPGHSNYHGHNLYPQPSRTARKTSSVAHQRLNSAPCMVECSHYRCQYPLCFLKRRALKGSHGQLQGQALLTTFYP